VTYVCTLSNQTGTVSVNLNGTFFEGDGPQFVLVNDVAILQAPYDSNGNEQSMLADLKFCTDQFTLRGQFKDGWGSLNWNSPTTNAEKLLALYRLETVPLVLTWPVSGTIQYCSFLNLTLGEQGGYGATISYNIILQFVAAT